VSLAGGGVELGDLWRGYPALRSAEPAGTADSERFVDDVYALLLPLLMPNGAGASHAE
jgi:hypothetical protein